MKLDCSLILLLLVVFTLGIMDTFSTVAAISSTGIAENESNLIYKIVYANNGMQGFIALKFIVTIGFALAAFIVQAVWQELRFTYVCLMAGLIVVGVIVTTSNLAIALGGNSIIILSMDALQFSLYILLTFFLFGVVMTIIHITYAESQKRMRDLHTEQSGTWMPGYNGKFRL